MAGGAYTSTNKPNPRMSARVLPNPASATSDHSTVEKDKSKPLPHAHAWFIRAVADTQAHRVAFTDDALGPDNPTLAEAFADLAGVDEAPEPTRVLAVLDERLADADPALTPRLLRRFKQTDLASRLNVVDVLPLTGGEAVKNDPHHLDTLHRAMLAHGLDRRSFILAIGGGALLDAAGYAAATLHRGVRLVRMPSTTLAQCDSGVGVKNAVNRFGVKNALGAFAVPHAVVNDAALLRTLPDDVWAHGFAEVVKVALLKDAELFTWLETHAEALAARDEALAQQAWRRSAELHLQHITEPPPPHGNGGGDPFERTTARPLDFGHWAGHRLEELSGHTLPHGHAVALGLAVDLHYAAHPAAGLLDPELARRAVALLAMLGLPTTHPLLAHPELPAGLEAFRQHLGGTLTITTITDLARPLDLHHLDPDALADVLQQRST